MPLHSCQDFIERMNIFWGAMPHISAKSQNRCLLFCFQHQIKWFQDTFIPCTLVCNEKKQNFRGELTDHSTETKSLIVAYRVVLRVWQVAGRPCEIPSVDCNSCQVSKLSITQKTGHARDSCPLHRSFLVCAYKQIQVYLCSTSHRQWSGGFV